MDELSDAGKRANLEYYEALIKKVLQEASKNYRNASEIIEASIKAGEKERTRAAVAEGWKALEQRLTCFNWRN